MSERNRKIPFFSNLKLFQLNPCCFSRVRVVNAISFTVAVKQSTTHVYADYTKRGQCVSECVVQIDLRTFAFSVFWKPVPFWCPFRFGPNKPQGSSRNAANACLILFWCCIVHMFTRSRNIFKNLSEPQYWFAVLFRAVTVCRKISSSESRETRFTRISC